MKIIITSGGTSEPIDQVRTITNHATGRLGQLMAERFLQAGHQVSFVTSKHALLPKDHPQLTIFFVTTVDSLIKTLEPLVKSHDAIIHAMAVSDYTPVYMTDLDTVASETDLTRFLDSSNTESKISSKADYQVLFLKKTPKVIGLIKTWNPTICLIGFKLLVDVTKAHLFDIARQSLSRNQADAIVANDLSSISGDQHIAYLLEEKTEQMASSKQELADLLLTYLENKEKPHA